VLPQLKASLFAQVDLSGLTEKLMLGKQDPEALSSRDKMQLWQELKTLSFTRTVCAMWAISLLDVFIHIQLNILGRHVYLDTAKNMSKSKEVHVPLSLSCQKKFIAFAGYLPHKGLQLLVTDTHEAVDIVLKGKDLKEPCTLDDLRDVFMKIRAMIDNRQEGWAQYVLPAENALPDGLVTASSAVDIAADAPPANDLFDDREELAQLMIETRAVLASNEFQEVLAVCLDAILDGVMEEVHSVYRGAPNHGIPLAKLLPPIAGSGITLLSHPDENRFLQILATLPQVQSFCALVYTTTSEEAKV
jgi:peroxin-3